MVNLYKTDMLFIDMTVDKTYLVEKIYAPLRLHFMERGYNLEIVDPHWAMEDLTTDDHSETEFCVGLIKECQLSSMPINFVVSSPCKRFSFVCCK